MIRKPKVQPGDSRPESTISFKRMLNMKAIKNRKMYLSNLRKNCLIVFDELAKLRYFTIPQRVGTGVFVNEYLELTNRKDWITTVRPSPLSESNLK